MRCALALFNLRMCVSSQFGMLLYVRFLHFLLQNKRIESLFDEVFEPTCILVSILKLKALRCPRFTIQAILCFHSFHSFTKPFFIFSRRKSAFLRFRIFIVPSYQWSAYIF
ncbi:unnamed protein product [Albugo candida]|uniref:Uncharacterized protein n=1 Tax=Albugo candida TaxID=65357 RepID=A0A024FTG1_9STRA|nr:unnamed protein product [Albugo candida]|eukprot:CCI10202.1 unnamed protein product [Albugo candida]